jgi:hypothetical protein
MKIMRVTQVTFWAALCIVAMGVPAARAQQQGQQQPQDKAEEPIPAYHSPLASAADNGADDTISGPQTLIPDNRPLAGAQVFSVGGPAETHSYWQPHVDFTSTLASNGLSATSNTGWTSWSSFFGGVDLHRNSGNSSLSLFYTGGAMISNSGDANNGIIQNLQFAERLAYRRATITILDQLSYLPQAAFGSQIPGAGGLPGSGSIGLQPGISPGQSILTAQGQSINNSFVPQLDVYLTPRSSLTFSGTYSLLHYFDNAQLNYYSAGVQAGYNYQVTRKDTLALIYRFNAFRYSNFNQSIDDHVVQISYGRRVTGKLAFQVAAGPGFTSFAIPITTTGGTGTGTTPSSSSGLYWSLNTSMTYRLQRTGFGLSYSHGVGGGSGVQAGSIADTVTGNVSHQFSRTFSGMWNLGYARNNGLTVTAPTSTTHSTLNQTYGYWTNNVGLSHAIGRTMNMSVYYLLQYQNSSASFCVGPTCGSSLLVHQISLSFGWHEHPLGF